MVRDLLAGRVRALGECGEVWGEVGRSELGWGGEFRRFYILSLSLTPL